MSNDSLWEQVRAGLALIQWSRLAYLDDQDGKVVLVATPEECFEKVAVPSIHKEYGRVIAWIAFSVGCEYLLKGVCIDKKGLTEEEQWMFSFPPKGQTQTGAWKDEVINTDLTQTHSPNKPSSIAPTESQKSVLEMGHTYGTWPRKKS